MIAALRLIGAMSQWECEAIGSASIADLAWLNNACGAPTLYNEKNLDVWTRDQFALYFDGAQVYQGNARIEAIPDWKCLAWNLFDIVSRAFYFLASSAESSTLKNACFEDENWKRSR